MNVIIISGQIPTDAIYSNATSVGLITKSNAISERAVLCELKIEAFKRGADAIVNYKQSTDNGHATYANSGIGPLPIKFDHYCAQGEAIRLKN